MAHDARCGGRRGRTTGAQLTRHGRSRGVLVLLPLLACACLTQLQPSAQAQAAAGSQCESHDRGCMLEALRGAVRLRPDGAKEKLALSLALTVYDGAAKGAARREVLSARVHVVPLQLLAPLWQ